MEKNWEYKHREIALQFPCDQVIEGNCCPPHYSEPIKFIFVTQGMNKRVPYETLQDIDENKDVKDICFYNDKLRPLYLVNGTFSQMWKTRVP